MLEELKDILKTLSKLEEKEDKCIYEKDSPIELKDLVYFIKEENGKLYKTRIDKKLYDFEWEILNENGVGYVFEEHFFPSRVK